MDGKHGSAFGCVAIMMMMAETTAMITVCECSHQWAHLQSKYTNPLKTKDEAKSRFEMKSLDEKYHKNATQNKQY